MPLNIVDRGSGNQIEIDPEVLAASTGELLLTGSDNFVAITRGCTLSNANLILGRNSSLMVEPDCRLAALEVLTIDGGHVSIGTRTNFTWHTRLLLHEAGRLSIGSGGLVASETLLTISDMHSILDRRTGVRINPAADIVVEDEVWLAHQVTVLKGVRIGTGSVIGMGSIVTRDVPRQSLAAGRPATVIREDIAWSQNLV